MKINRNESTPDGKAFWDHARECASEVANWPESKRALFSAEEQGATDAGTVMREDKVDVAASLARTMEKAHEVDAAMTRAELRHARRLIADALVIARELDVAANHPGDTIGRRWLANRAGKLVATLEIAAKDPPTDAPEQAEKGVEK